MLRGFAPCRACFLRENTGVVVGASQGFNIALTSSLGFCGHNLSVLFRAYKEWCCAALLPWGLPPGGCARVVMGESKQAFE